MPKFLENKLKKEYPGNPSAVYGTLNNIGAMHGNKETAKGAAMEAKHNSDMRKKKKAGSFGGLKPMKGLKPKPAYGGDDKGDLY